MEPMTKTVARTKPAPAKPRRWKRAAYILIDHTAGGIAIGLWFGAGTLIALELLVPPL